MSHSSVAVSSSPCDVMAIKSDILSAVKNAQAGTLSYSQIYSGDVGAGYENEFLFFIKPELTLKSGIDFPSVLDLVFEKISEFGLAFTDIKVIGASYLKQYQIIDQHYGQINKLAKNAKRELSDSAREKFKATFGVPVEDADVLGGFEFMDRYPFFNPTSLEYLWQNKQNTKLSGGTYCLDVKMDAEKVYLVNGFHPFQILHFTEQGRSIVTFTLKGDLSWQDARQKFIGATKPQDAEVGSLRNTLLARKEELGIPEISQGTNGVHLSAGPVEGVLELARYNSDYANNKMAEPTDFSFGQKLASNFTPDQVKKVLSNTNVAVDGKNISIFDLTEEKSSNEAIQIIKAHLK